MDVPLDAQRIELMGRNLLVTELIRNGLEIARPERDRGIDLIVYSDRGAIGPSGGPFRAVPIQMKAFSKSGFGIDRKYMVIPGLFLAYLWNVTDPHQLEAYLLTYPEAVGVGEAMGWLGAASWTKGGRYITTRPSARLRELLSTYRVDGRGMRWGRRLVGMMQSGHAPLP